MKKQNRLSIIILIFITINVFFRILSTPPNQVFTYDTFGFYMYLPNTFIYNEIAPTDITFLEEINDKYGLSSTLYQITKAPTDKYVIRFFSGISILLLPFFFIGHVIALIGPWEADGYSLPYQWAVIMAAPTYFIIGLFYIRKILIQFFKDHVIALSLALLYMGSNIYFFSSVGNPFPHIFVFTLYALLIWHTIKWHDTKKMKDARIVGMLIGFLTITRLSELIGLLIPLLWGIYDLKSLKEKVSLLLTKKHHIYNLIFFAFLGGLPQIIYWLITTHQPYFTVYNDPQSQLELSNPRFLYTLFSYRKGWLVYAPLMTFSLIGFYFNYKNKKDSFLPVFAIFFINLYLIASFTSLVGYGYRAFIQSYAFMIIPFTCFIDFIINRKLIYKVLFAIIIIPIIFINIFQATQISYGVLHGSRTTQEYYWRVFLKKTASEEDKKYLLVNRSNDKMEYPELYNSEIVIEEDFNTPNTSNQKQYLKLSDSINDSYCFHIKNTEEFTNLHKCSYKDLTRKDHVFLEFEIDVKSDSIIYGEEIYIITTFSHNGYSYKYRSYNLGAQKSGVNPENWKTIKINYLTPEVRSKNDNFSIYIWNKSKTSIKIDNFKFRKFER